ncbi:hypothetical protein BHM03_00035532 [Ensete ventricosum]|nr:hypothetical protein BHM03_00035532 [Ensete ventricosum]
MGGTYRSVRLPVRDVLARTPSPPSPAGTFSPARGDRTSPRAGRKIEAADTFYKVCNFDLYPLVWAVRTGLLGYRYVDRPLPGGTAKIDLRWLIEGEKLKKKKRKIRKKYLISLRCPCPRTVATLARGRFFSRARRRNFSPCGEKDRGDHLEKERNHLELETKSLLKELNIQKSERDKLSQEVGHLELSLKQAKITGTQTARYRAVPSKIGRRRPILKEIDRRRSIEEEKGKKKRKRSGRFRQKSAVDGRF